MISITTPPNQTKPDVSDQPYPSPTPHSDPEPILLSQGLPPFDPRQPGNYLRLRLEGYSDEEAERLSRPKPMDRRTVLERLVEEQKKRWRWMAELDRERDKLKKAAEVELDFELLDPVQSEQFSKLRNQS